jgi:hypothetical protein
MSLPLEGAFFSGVLCMWRRCLIHVSSILQALMFSAALLWMALGTSRAQNSLVTYVKTGDDAVISQMLIKETTINDYRLNLFENGTNPFNFVAVEFNVNSSGRLVSVRQSEDGADL